MHSVFVFATLFWLWSLSVADWRDFIDPETLSKFDESQSRYDTEKWEGDITNLEPEEMPQNAAANAADDANQIWPNNTIPYEFTTRASIRIRAAERKMITEAMEVTMLLTGHCVKFIERTTETDYIRFQKGLLCYSDIGRTGGRQIVSYSSACLKHYGSIQHELMHVLGFFHEQSRLDRDKYVTINWDNIAEENKAQFAQRAGETYGLPYDSESVMHYEVKAFAKDPMLPTILPNVWRAKLGQKENLSPLDVTRIHRRFRCRVPSVKNFMMSQTSDSQAVQNNRREPSAGAFLSRTQSGTTKQVQAAVQPQGLFSSLYNGSRSDSCRATTVATLTWAAAVTAPVATAVLPTATVASAAANYSASHETTPSSAAVAASAIGLSSLLQTNATVNVSKPTKAINASILASALNKLGNLLMRRAFVAPNKAATVSGSEATTVTAGNTKSSNPFPSGDEISAAAAQQVSAGEFITASSNADIAEDETEAPGTAPGSTRKLQM